MWLPFGRVRYPLDLGARAARWLVAPDPGPEPEVTALIEDALEAPLGGMALERSGARRITIIVSDLTRREPQRAFVEAVARRAGNASLTVAIATGTHGPVGARIHELDLPRDVLARAKLVDHDGHSDRDLVHVGMTRRGTPVRVHRCLLDCDLIVATGCIKPHYFAGFGGGIKAVFPGLGGEREIRLNHAFKRHPDARAGRVEGNPCREDLEEASALVPTPKFLLNGVVAPDHAIHAVVAGEPGLAFELGAELARSWWTVSAPRANVVIASDRLPVTASLYQSAKIAAAVAPLVAENGTLVLVAECGEGTGPLHTVNDEIFKIGVLPRLARGVTVSLISKLSEGEVRKTLLRYASGLEAILSREMGETLVIPYGSGLICEPIV